MKMIRSSLQKKMLESRAINKSSRDSAICKIMDMCEPDNGFKYEDILQKYRGGEQLVETNSLYKSQKFSAELCVSESSESI